VDDKHKQRMQQADEWQERYESDTEDPRQLFQQVSSIAVVMSYDLIDKLRWWEKEVLKLPDEEIAKRIPTMATFLDRLRVAYVEFSDQEI